MTYRSLNQQLKTVSSGAYYTMSGYNAQDQNYDSSFSYCSSNNCVFW